MGRGIFYQARKRSARVAVLVPLALAATGAHAEEPPFQGHLAGDWGGTRTLLKDKGVDIGLKYTGEVLGNVAGGLKRGASWEGLFDVTFEADLDKLVGWRGARTHIRVFHIHTCLPTILSPV